MKMVIPRGLVDTSGTITRSASTWSTLSLPCAQKKNTFDLHSQVPEESSNSEGRKVDLSNVHEVAINQGCFYNSATFLNVTCYCFLRCSFGRIIFFPNPDLRFSLMFDEFKVDENKYKLLSSSLPGE